MTAAPRLFRHDERLLTARVVLQHDDTCSVAVEDSAFSGEIVARRAASCLLAPRPGDRVLLALAPEPFVLAVLERENGTPSEVILEGDATVRTAGRLTLEGEEGMRLRSPRSIELLSAMLSVKSRAASLVFEQVESFAARARAGFDEATLISRTIDRVADRIAEKAGRVYRFVSEVDQLRARHFDYRAEHSAQIKSETTVIAARHVVKVDGEQVHIG